MVQGKSREYVLHVPAAGAGRPRPLVIVLHGGAGSGPNVKGFSMYDPVSDQFGFLAAYPSGMRGSSGGHGTPRSAAAWRWRRNRRISSSCPP